MIDQAIFTSAETDRAAGYQLVASSAGVDTADLRELAVWGPSHDSLVDSGPDATSVNFHPLPSGSYCVSKTSAAGGEYSGRSGPQVYTQCLIVPPETLQRFANNPFALLNAAFAQGSLEVRDAIPGSLKPFQIGGKAGAVDQTLLAQLKADPGPGRFAALVDAALATPSLAIFANRNRERLVAGLINALPVECRIQFSFSTGLKQSPRRPFRIVALADSAAERTRLQRIPELTTVEMSQLSEAVPEIPASWGALLAQILTANKSAAFSAQLAHPRAGMSIEDLPALACELLQSLHGGTASKPVAAPPAASPRLSTDESSDASQRRADGAHRRTVRGVSPAAASSVAELADAPSQKLALHDPRVVERLELLDDTVFEAIAGKPSALETLRTLWPSVLAEVPAAMVDESREQYVRHALKVWRECVQGDEIHNPALAIHAMDVMCILFEGPGGV